MPDPLDFVPLALAAGGGQIDGQPVAGLVAAGHALLQRSATLVRALSGRRSAIMLPPGASFLTALAASDGRGAVLVHPSPDSADGWDQLALLIEAERVGAVFTTELLADCVPPSVTVVCLDGSPRKAVVRSGGQDRVVDLGSHFGLDLAGDARAEGSPEACISIGGSWFSHRDLLAAARQDAARHPVTAGDEAMITIDWSAALVTHIAAVLLLGGRVVTPQRGG